jgi:hypothetical protein
VISHTASFAPSGSQDRGDHLLPSETEVGHGTIDILMLQGLLGLHEVAFQDGMDAIRKGFSRRVSPQLSAEFIPGKGVLEDAPGLHAGDGLIVAGLTSPYTSSFMPPNINVHKSISIA